MWHGPVAIVSVYNLKSISRRYTTMAFITAATRSDIVELAMGMLNKAPSTTMLNTLVEKSSAGSTMQDLADYIATTDAFIAEYPSTQTAREFATEMFGKLITGGTLDAAINTAVIDLLEGMLTAGTTKAEGFVAVIDYLSNTANNTNADLGDISKSFQNRADAAEYFSITKELGGSTDAELAAAIATVTSDAATLTAANAATDATAAAVPVVASEALTLTTGVDNYTGGAGADTIYGTIDTTTTTNNTFAVSDVINGAAGEDLLQIAINNSPAVTYTPALITNVENVRVINLDAEDAVAFDMSATSGITTAEIQASIKGASFDNLDAGTKMIATANTAATDFGFKAAGLTGEADAFDLTLNSNGNAVTIATNGAGFESGTITALGVNGTRAYVGAGSDLKTITVKGAGSVGFNGGSLANVTLFDASENSGGVVFDSGAAESTITGGAGNDVLTEGSGNDVLKGNAGHDTLTGGTSNDNIDGGAGNDVVVASSIDQNDTISGGEGTDVLSIGTAVAYSASNTDDGSNVTGFEVLSHTSTIVQDMTALSGNTISAVVFGGDNNLTLRNVTTAITSVTTKTADGTLTVGLTTDGAADTLTHTTGGTAAQNLVLNAVDYEVINTSATGVNSNSLTLGNALALTGATGETDSGKTVADLTTVNITGNKTFTLTASNAYLTQLATVDASGFTGDQLNVDASGSDVAMTISADIGSKVVVTSGIGADKITVGSGGSTEANSVTSGKGNDTIISGSANDTINSGEGDDSITSNAGNDNITTGAGADYVDAGIGNDTIAISGEGANTVKGGEGNDSVTGGGDDADHLDMGAGNDQAAGGAGNDTIIGGAGNDSSLAGGAGDDSVTGGTGNDTLTGGTGADYLDGGDGNDNISDGTGNDTVLGGDGIDTITISSGSDSVDAGAGNDVLTITGLSSADTISGGAGTDSMTITNSSSASITPKFTNIESIAVNTSTNFTLSMAEATDTTSLKTFTVTSTAGEDGNANSDDVTLTKIASGSTVTISDDSTWDGASAEDTDTDGDLDDVAISTVAGGTLTVNINADEDALVHAATNINAGTVFDIDGAASVTLNSSNGDTNNINNTVTALELDDSETMTLAVVANDYASLVIGDITASSALQSLTLTNGVGASGTDVGVMVDAESLQTLSITATGASSAVVIDKVGGTTDAQLSSLNLTAADGGSINSEDSIASDQSTALTAVTFAATGSGSALTIDAHETTFGTGTIAELTIEVGSNSSFDFKEGDIPSGLITLMDIDLASYSTLDGNAGDGENDVDLDFDGAVTTVDLNIGTGVTFTDGEEIQVSGDVGTFKLTTSLLTEAVIFDSSNTLDIGGANMFDVDNVLSASYTHTGTGTLNWTGTGITGSAAEGAQVISSNVSTATSDTITGAAGNDTLTGNAGTNTITGGTGIDTIKGNAGADSLDGGAGNDIITAGAGADTVNGGADQDSINITGSPTEADVLVIEASETAETSDSGNFLAEGGEAGEARGQDTVSGFDSSYDVLQVVLTTSAFSHAEDIAVSTFTGEGAGGTVGYYAKNTLLINSDSAEDAIFDNGGDVVVTFNDFKTAGVSQLDAENTLVIGDVSGNIQYNITGTSANNTIVTGTLGDTVTGGDGADAINLGSDSAVDHYVINAITDGAALAADEATTADTVTNFDAGEDKIVIGKTMEAALGNVGNAGTLNISAANGGAINKSTADSDVFVIDNATQNDLDDLSNVIGTIGNTTYAEGDDFFVIVNNAAGTSAGVYYIEGAEANTGAAILTSEIALVGIITTDAAIATTDVILGS